MHQYTGTTNPGHVGRTMTNHLLVEFHSDATNSDRGFRAVASRHVRGGLQGRRQGGRERKRREGERNRDEGREGVRKGRKVGEGESERKLEG